MKKKQLIEIICIIAGISLAIKAIDYLQFFITGFFQLLQGHGYTEFYYCILISRAIGISREICKRLDPSDILLDLDSSTALEYAMIIIGGIAFISGLTSFLGSLVRSLTMEGILTISGNYIWLNGLIKMLVGALVIYKAKALARLVKR